jgi:DNA-binding HxlR family transcriptional regulator
MKKNKSFCPVNQALEIIGDQWTLLIIRDIMFHGKRHFREFLSSEENIATNILANRLNRLEELQIVVKSKDAHHKQKNVYTLNYKGIALIPVMFELYCWTGPFANLGEKDKELVMKLINGGENLKHKMKTELIKEIRDLFKNDDDLFRAHQERFAPLVRRMSDII